MTEPTQPRKPGRPVGSTKPKTGRGQASFWIDKELWERFRIATWNNRSGCITEMMKQYLKEKP